MNCESSANFEEHFHAVDKKKDDDNEHEARIAAIEYVSVELVVFMFSPQENEFRDEERVGDQIKCYEAEKWFW